MAKITLDWNEYLLTARRAAAEGIVLLENNGALPIDTGAELSVFGRMQLNYYKSGTGSGGMVNVAKVWNVMDGLRESGVKINEKLAEIYAEWDAANRPETGEGWGGEPWHQPEMPLSDEMCENAAKTSSQALCVIARTAGEEQDCADKEGSYRLTALELEMLKTVRRHFAKMTVALNVGAVMDMSFVAEIKPDAVLYIWQGGMVGGLSAADVLTGKVSPCGRLADTIAKNVEDYPSSPYLDIGGSTTKFYKEDIYVGYRYFETFAKDKVLYPFGYGLSYTRFEISTLSANFEGGCAVIEVSVKNVGGCSGKEVVQLYSSSPQGKLGKPALELRAYAKTRELLPNEAQTLRLEVSADALAAFDDSGVTGHKNCFVLEAGEYSFYVGRNVRDCEKALTVSLEERVVSELSDACAPVQPFERMVNNDGAVAFEPVPTITAENERQRRAASLPADIPQTGDKGIKLADVKSGKASMEEFVAQFSDEALAGVIRGEGMGSPKVTPGTASAFGGAADSVAALGVPCCCCDDGPSGMRLDCGTNAFSLPGGTLLACTFDTELMQTLFTLAGIEIAANKVDCLLGPGMNIHRHPLNGRNFEYFSEDPYLTGTIAAAQLKGMNKANVYGTIKHFCANNLETGRHFIDSVVSARALREIYLKGFEIAVKQGGAKSVMTTYGQLNGLYTAGNFDLCTQILRSEWGYDGFLMTDWWAHINERGKPGDHHNFAQMARAQNDTYMCCRDSSREVDGETTLAALADGSLTRGELQRSAANVCRFAMNSNAMKRLCGCEDEIEIINRPAEDYETIVEDVEFSRVSEGTTLPLDITTEKGKRYVFGIETELQGIVRVTITARSNASATAQMPVTFFTEGYPAGVYTFNGTDGKPVEISREVKIYSRFITCRLQYAQGGLHIESIRFEFVREFP